MEIEDGPFQRRITLRRGRRSEQRRGELRPGPAHGRASARPEAACGQRRQSCSAGGGRPERFRTRRHRRREGHRDPDGPAGPAAEGDGRLPAIDDAARDRAGALDQARRRRRLRRPDAGTGHGRERRGRGARLGRSLRRRHRRDRPQADPRTRRNAADPGPGAPADQARAADRRRPVPDRRVRGDAGRDRGDQGARGTDAQRPEPVRADHRGRPVSPGGAPDRGRERRRPECALAPRRLDDAPEDRREAGPARHHRRRGAAARHLAHPQPRARGDRARLEDPVPGPVGDGEGSARVLPPPAAEGDPGRARRGGRPAGRSERAPRAARGAGAARGRPQGGRARALAARQAAAGRGRVRRHPHLPRLDPDAAVEQGDRGQPRPRPGAQSPRRGPLRPRQGQGPDHRVPRRLEAEGRRLRSDPLLRRAARRRQDLTRPVDRADARAEVRAHLRRRCPRRGRGPRASAHIHRRDARDDHPGPARRRVDEPGLPDRRDRQAGRRLARRPCERDARGARPGAELDVPRPLPRPTVRPLEGAVHLHRESAGDDPRTAARPDGRDPALGLYRGREGRDREALPAAETARGQRPEAEAGQAPGRQHPSRHPRVHARGGRSGTSSGGSAT